MESECDKKAFTYRKKVYVCPLELAMDLIGGKWKTLMIFHLKEGAMRTSELMRALPGISNKMFTQTARELERDHIITRTVYPVSPPRVEYALSDLGHSVLPCILQMEAWGKQVMSG